MGRDLDVTPWRSGRLDARQRRPRLLFGRMYEDPTVELAALPEGGRVLAVASAGDVALALARAGRQVTAIDVNPAQVAYVAARMAGAAPIPGAVDRLLGAGRAFLRLAGWRRGLVDWFCDLDDPAVQAAMWRAELATPAVRRLAAAALRPALLRLAYGRAFVDAAPSGLGRTLLRRVEVGVGRHANRSNPWIHLLLRGRWTLEEPALPPLGSLRLLHTELAAHLDSVPSCSYDGFALSNVLDGPGPTYRTRLLAAVRRAAAPGAVAVLRTLAVPASAAAAEHAANDRALIWGGVGVVPTKDLI